ncbi:MAG: thiamine-phosphate kinase [Balneolaceae bacterium]
MTNKTFTSVQELGFTKLVDRIQDQSSYKHPSVKKGIGDDASVQHLGNGQVICTTSEIFLEGVHFDLTYTPFHHLGYKVVTAAVSDLYAMNAAPVQLLIDIAVPNRCSVEMIEEFYRGVHKACNDYQVMLSGGDSTASHQLLAISVTAIGEAAEEDVVYRSGAKEGQVICITGDLGAAIAGLRILLREKQHWKESGENHFHPDLADYEYVVQRQLVPKLQTAFSDALRQAGVLPGAMADVTQGLVHELHSIARQSQVGIELYSPAVPIALETRRVADEMQEDVDKYAFYGGEDFELLFTIDEADVEKLKAEFEDFVVVGNIKTGEKTFTIRTGEDKTIEFDLTETIKP